MAVPLDSTPLFESDLLDSLNHCQSHVDTIGGVLRPADGEAANTVVAIAQDLDSHALVLLECRENRESISKGTKRMFAFLMVWLGLLLKLVRKFQTQVTFIFYLEETSNQPIPKNQNSH